MEAAKAAFRVELGACEGVLVFGEVAVDDLAEGIVVVASLLFALVVPEGDDAAEAVVGVEELAAVGAVLVVVVALGDVIFLAGDDAAARPVVGDDLLAVLAADLLQNFEAVVEEAGTSSTAYSDISFGKSYDGNENMVAKIFPNQTGIDLVYDQRNRLVQEITFPGNLETLYTYDAKPEFAACGHI